VESVLDKDGYTLEELLDEEEIIQECKALNSRLINFLRGKAQVRSLLCFVIEEPPENAENKRAFKFPFIACEIFTCDVEVIFKTLVEDDAVSGTTFSVFTLCRGINCPLKSLRVDPWPVQLFLF
jgi:serine/threonine-protein phosphatase 6 regulatory subunit 3